MDLTKLSLVIYDPYKTQTTVDTSEDTYLIKWEL